MELYFWIYFFVSLITVIVLWRDRSHNSETINRLSGYLAVLEFDLEQSKELAEEKDKEISKRM